MTAEVTIICDGCAFLLTAAKTTAVARRELRAAGGRSAFGFDYCPACIKEGKDEPLKQQRNKKPWAAADRNGGLGPDQWTPPIGGVS